MKIIVNNGNFPFGLSETAYQFLKLDWQKLVIWPLERAGAGMSKVIEPMGMKYFNDRTNPKLIKCVEKLGNKAGVPGTNLYIAEIPDGSVWYIEIDESGSEKLRYTALT